MAVAVMLPGDRLQQPVTPVQNEANTDTKAMMNKAIIERPISVSKRELLTLFIKNSPKSNTKYYLTIIHCSKITLKLKYTDIIF